jgi:hypothetical protein
MKINNIQVVSYLDTEKLSKEFFSMIKDVFSFLDVKNIIGLEKVLDRIILRHKEGFYDSSSNYGLYYRPPVNRIILIIQKSKANFFKNEEPLYFNALVHEISHALQENLHPEALQFWNTPWIEYTFETFKNSNSFVLSVIKRLFQVEGDISKIEFDNLNDYLKFFCLFHIRLEEYHFEYEKLRNHFKKMKPFHEIEGSTVIKDFFSDPANQNLLFKDFPTRIKFYFNKQDLETSQVKRYINSLNYVTDLEVPSKLHDSPHEDWAETFRLWLITPNRLEGKQKERLLRTLWISGFYGRKIVPFRNIE